MKSPNSSRTAAFALTFVLVFAAGCNSVVDVNPGPSQPQAHHARVSFETTEIPQREGVSAGSFRARGAVLDEGSVHTEMETSKWSVTGRKVLFGSQGTLVISFEMFQSGDKYYGDYTVESATGSYSSARAPGEIQMEISDNELRTSFSSEVAEAGPGDRITS